MPVTVHEEAVQQAAPSHDDNPVHATVHVEAPHSTCPAQASTALHAISVSSAVLDTPVSQAACPQVTLHFFPPHDTRSRQESTAVHPTRHESVARHSMPPRQLA